MKKTINAIVALALAAVICSCTAYNEKESEDMPEKCESIFSRLIGMDAEGLNFSKLYEISLDGYETEHVGLRAEWITDGINIYYRAVPEEFSSDVLNDYNEEVIWDGITYYIASYNVHVDTFSTEGAKNYSQKRFLWNEDSINYYLIYSCENDQAPYATELATAVKELSAFVDSPKTLENYREYWCVTLKNDNERIYIKLYPSDNGKSLLNEFIAEQHVSLNYSDDATYYFGAKIMPNPEVTEEKLMADTGIGILEIEASIITDGKKERETENNVVTIDLAQLFLSQFINMQ